MNTVIVRNSLLKNLKASVCAATLAGTLMMPGFPALGADNPAAKAPAAASQPVQDTTAQDKTAEKRKQIIAEAVSAVQETNNALKALDDDKKDDALAALERASGKLDVILARDPQLALAPMGVSAATYDVAGTIEGIKETERQAETLLASGRVQAARQILKGLGSETVISVSNIPLSTYPLAIKEAARLIDNGQADKAKETLQTALNTLVITEVILPLPVMRAHQILKEAEALAEKKDRTASDGDRLNKLLDDAHAQIELAQALGYGTKSDFDVFYEEIKSIKDKTSNGKSGTGFFEKIKSAMTAMTDNSQHGTDTANGKK